MNRIEREKATISQMVKIYCNRHHGQAAGTLCRECSELLDYAHKRLDHCPGGNKKPSCRKCKIHCYAPTYRAEVREIMRYVGPRMLFIHPFTSIRHIFSELR